MKQLFSSYSAASYRVHLTYPWLLKVRVRELLGPVCVAPLEQHTRGAHIYRVQGHKGDAEKEGDESETLTHHRLSLCPVHHNKLHLKDPISSFFGVNDCIWVRYYWNRVKCLYVKMTPYYSHCSVSSPACCDWSMPCANSHPLRSCKHFSTAYCVKFERKRAVSHTY